MSANRHRLIFTCYILPLVFIYFFTFIIFVIHSRYLWCGMVFWLKIRKLAFAVELKSVTFIRICLIVGGTTMMVWLFSMTSYSVEAFFCFIRAKRLCAARTAAMSEPHFMWCIIQQMLLGLVFESLCCSFNLWYGTRFLCTYPSSQESSPLASFGQLAEDGPLVVRWVILSWFRCGNGLWS
jgi:hypothetical protein